ncbi:MAG: nodulation protein NodJ [Gammaproteobacteria bacterium SG8_47]|nr:MAG: nodulation protein NodJ [Gammaproteobacteria bacterium SG8_47]
MRLTDGVRWLPVWWRNFRVWRKLLGAALLGNIGEPLLYLIALGYGLGAFVGQVDGLDYVTFLASGIVCSSAMNTASFEGMYSAYTRMEVQQTWISMLTAPLGIADVVVGEAMWAATKSLISAVAIYIVAAALGAVSGWASVWVLPIAFLVGLCFGAWALVITALSHSYDTFLYYFTLILTPMLLLSGVFFPLDAMPPAVGYGAALFPLSHAIALVRPLMTGGELGPVWLHLTVVGVYAAVALVIAVRLLNRRLMT